MIRVLLVDDEPLVCSYLAAILGTAADIDVIGVEHDGAAAVDAVVRMRPDVVLMDLRMPGVDGATAIRRIRHLDLPAKVLTLNIFDTDESVRAAMRAGADGFLLKSTPPSDLINVVRVVAQGQSVLSASIARRLVTAVTGPAADDVRSRIESLTGRERDVLALLATGRTNAEIGVELDLTEATIKGHVSRILVKLGVDNRTRAGLLALTTGLGN